MNERHAQYMLTVLQEGSITGAAKKLFISQPSLSQMIKQVEHQLGAPIFNRSTDPITLTYAGQKYIEAAKQILTIHTNLEKAIEEITMEDHGKIRFGIPVQRAMLLLPTLLPAFYEKYPHVEVEIHEHGSAAMEKLVLDGVVDLACLTTSPQNEDLNYVLVKVEELMLLASKDTELARRIPDGTPIPITEARKEKFVSNKPGHNVRVIQDNLFITNNMKPKILLETVSIEVEKKVALACGGVMICPKEYIDSSPETAARAHVYPILGVENRRHCYICHRRDLYLTKYMKDFIQMAVNGAEVLQPQQNSADQQAEDSSC